MSERAPSRNENHLLHVGDLTALPAERTQRLLDKLQAARPEVEIETKVLQHPRRALRDGVFMIPALIVGQHRWYHAPPLHEILAALDAVASQR